MRCTSFRYAASCTISFETASQRYKKHRHRGTKNSGTEVQFQRNRGVVPAEQRCSSSGTEVQLQRHRGAVNRGAVNRGKENRGAEKQKTKNRKTRFCAERSLVSRGRNAEGPEITSSDFLDCHTIDARGTAASESFAYCQHATFNVFASSYAICVFTHIAVLITTPFQGWSSRRN